ncbi:hypothetical protein ABT299_52190 [Spirillospora sp. NPDC000708]
MKIVTDAVLRDVERLSERTGEAAARVKAGADCLDVESAGLVVEHLCESLEAVWGMLAAVGARVQQITERETPEQAGRSTMKLMGSAAVHLELGCGGLTLAQHVLMTGRADLLRVERGDDL